MDEAVEQPFHAEFAGFPNLSPTADPCVLVNEPTAVGNATHLGKTSFEAVELINACVYPIEIRSNFVLVAANGDELYGSIDVLQTFNADGSVSVEGPYTMGGGTGRFVGATGSGTWTVRFANPTAPAVVTADGTITY